jgi:DNA-binding NtrC family response regulator
MHILTVDDDPAVLAGLVSVLETEHDVLACGGGEEALAALRARPFDLVLTDLRMPAPDGLEVLRTVQAMASAPPVVVLTAMDTARSAVEALQLGACDYLVKPVEPRELLAAVARVGGEHPPPGAGEEFGMTGQSAASTAAPPHSLLAASREGPHPGETGVGKTAWRGPSTIIAARRACRCSQHGGHTFGLRASSSVTSGASAGPLRP